MKNGQPLPWRWRWSSACGLAADAVGERGINPCRGVSSALECVRRPSAVVEHPATRGGFVRRHLQTCRLVDAAIDAMLEELDPHTVYFSGEELASMSENMEGNFEGIGVEFIIQDDTLMVVAAIPGGPSDVRHSGGRQNPLGGRRSHFRPRLGQPPRHGFVEGTARHGSDLGFGPPRARISSPSDPRPHSHPQCGGGVQHGRQRRVHQGHSLCGENRTGVRSGHGVFGGTRSRRLSSWTFGATVVDT